MSPELVAGLLFLAALANAAPAPKAQATPSSVAAAPTPIDGKFGMGPGGALPTGGMMGGFGGLGGGLFGGLGGGAAAPTGGLMGGLGGHGGHDHGGLFGGLGGAAAPTGGLTGGLGGDLSGLGGGDSGELAQQFSSLFPDVGAGGGLAGTLALPTASLALPDSIPLPTEAPTDAGMEGAIGAEGCVTCADAMTAK